MLLSTSQQYLSMPASNPAPDSFGHQYEALRDFTPMRWMERMFGEIAAGDYPRLVDLPCGAGKTDLVFLWLIALARYGMQRPGAKAVPRRLVWVVNRRVLVQQVYRIAQALRERLADSSTLAPVRSGLTTLGADAQPFEIVELRGQTLQDRDWVIRPAAPQLIVGTVDQIGSRLLFQGYGLGKWGRAQHAGILGTDTWVAVDEAHLVPAFVLTLRQIHAKQTSSLESLPLPLAAAFARLPFWLTELSGTPGLPPPTPTPFRLTEHEREDPALRPRLAAEATRRAVIEVPAVEKKQLPGKLAEKALQLAHAGQVRRIAIFVREATAAASVARGLKSKNVCLITGRLRGYERERLADNVIFRRFVGERTSAEGREPCFLVGTAAAEVGLDADADAIVCDFADLPTLLQRLGRLDRRGQLSTSGIVPQMHIMGVPPEPDSAVAEKLQCLAKDLRAANQPVSGALLAGAAWAEADEKQLKAWPLGATRKILAEAAAPNDWSSCELAAAAAPPVQAPPLTDAVLGAFTATTEDRGPYLSPHPFLYGFTEDESSAPLIDVAFRLEVEALRWIDLDDDAESAGDVRAALEAIFTRFPPLRAELHHVSIGAVRDWLKGSPGSSLPLLYRDRDRWRCKLADGSCDPILRALRPGSTLILPAAANTLDGCAGLLKDAGGEAGMVSISDVLDGLQKAACYRRTIAPATGRVAQDGAIAWDSESEASPPDQPDPSWKQTFRQILRVGAVDYTFRYFRPDRAASQQLQYLDDVGCVHGHLTRAAAEAHRLAEAAAPGDAFLDSLLTTAARLHDEGKRFPKWQDAFGRQSAEPELAKLNPRLSRPRPLNGFRHEWESLRHALDHVSPPPGLPVDHAALWRDLVLHFVACHHGHVRPSIADEGLTPGIEPAKQNATRVDAALRFCNLQRQLGSWRLAYLEALIRSADVEASQVQTEDEQAEGDADES